MTKKEISKLKKEFKTIYSTMYSKNKNGINPFVSIDGIFDFFEPYLRNERKGK